MCELLDVGRTLLCVFDVERGAVQPIRVVAELPEATVAVEAKDASNLTRRVVVVNMVGPRSLADGANAALLADKVFDLRCAEAVAPLQVIVP
jgi:hypothetical protein